MIDTILNVAVSTTGQPVEIVLAGFVGMIVILCPFAVIR